MQLETFALERFQSIWENRVAWNLSESGVHPLTVTELLDTPADRDALLDVLLGYPQTNGTVELRQSIAGMYPGAAPENVQVTNGGSEANCVLLMHLVQPGDEIVCMLPNYMQIPGLARGLGATVRAWHLREEDGRWTADLDDLRALVTPRTRAICICNPNNPTGARLDAATLDAICAIAAPAGAWVVSDEIYRGAERVDDETPTIWGRYDRAVVTSGLSKAYGLPGLRIGWAVGPAALVSALWAVHDYTSIAPGAVNDRLARIALQPERRERILARTRGIIRANYPILRRWLERHGGFTHVPPDAGAIAFAAYDFDLPSTAFIERLRDGHGVLLVAGDHFDMPRHLRIGFGSDPEYLTAALDRVSDFIETIRADAG